MPVSITYRTAGAWGAGIGANLTPAQVDNNFYSIQQWIAAFEADPTPPNGISQIVQEGTQLFIYLDNSDVQGPFTLPSATAITPVVTKSGATLTIASEDRGTYMRCTNAAGCIITIPHNDDDPIPIHSEFHFRQCTAGPLNFEAPTDVVINGIAGFDDATDRVGAVATLKKVDENEYDLFGLLAVGFSTGTAT